VYRIFEALLRAWDFEAVIMVAVNWMGLVL